MGVTDSEEALEFRPKVLDVIRPFSVKRVDVKEASRDRDINQPQTSIFLSISHADRSDLICSKCLGASAHSSRPSGNFNKSEGRKEWAKRACQDYYLNVMTI
jgi:hypothetical protein